AYIAIYEQVNKIRPSNQLLILFRTIDNKFTLKVYDIEKKKFVKTFLDTVDDIDFQILDEMVWALESMKLTYKKAAIQGQMEIKLVDNAFQIISDKKQALKQKSKKSDYYDDSDEVEEPMEFEKLKKKKTLPKSDSISKTLKVVGIVKNHSVFQDTDKLYFENLRYRKQDYSLGFKEGKVGLIDNKEGEYIIPTKYDAIYKINDFSAFLIQKDNKYGIYFSYTDELIKPIFDDIPVVFRKAYNGKGLNLIALFDKETQKLKCYSTFDGSLFYIK
uniref:WG repeat-containing protein n=1 Tax=Winogradskyella sp. TaxID=1883156 RepID=UPI0025F68706